MGREKRRSTRIEVGLPVRIMISRRGDDEVMAEGPGTINDISQHGLRLTVSSAKLGDWHLFYSFHDDDRHQLILQTAGQSVAGDEAPAFSLEVRPVWFDRLLQRPDKPFQLGMEFKQPPPPETAKWLQKMIAARQPAAAGSWWRRLWHRS
ncbi:MAG: PilZ domain-containing protein [Desulfurivibrio sp.]|nr:PilZ domain-containing protein [Desulfurivibrio sp.]